MNRRRFLKTASGLLVPAAFASARAQGMLLNPYRFSGGAAPTYLVKQDFETATTGYDNGPEVWTEVGSTITPAFGTAPLAGTQSCKISGTNVRLTSPTFAGKDEIWFYLMANMTTVSAGTVNWFSVIGPGFGIDRLSDGTIRVSGSQNGTPTTNIASIGTTYHFLVHYLKGTGANGFFSVEFNTTATFAGSGNGYSQVTNGTETQQATAVRFLAEEATTVEYKIDKIRVDDVAIGNSPQ